jgi:thiol-disulfide isomerase/thioredoxin
MNETIDTNHPSEETADTTETQSDGQPDPALTDADQPTNRSPKPMLIAAGIAIIVLFGASQVFLLTSLGTTQAEIQAQIESLGHQMAELETSVVGVSEQVEDIARSAAAAEANSAPRGATPAPALPAGFLPRFTSEGPDQAIGMTLPTIEGIDAYSESAMKIDPADGTKRVWMIWAHWCPYCQQELPDLNAWWADASGNYPTAELITVTTSMDPSRGNPLEPYLEDQQFVFPVVVDTDTRIAAQMGVNAFPFWIVTDGDGTVLFRTAGLLDIDRVETLFSQLEQFES